MISTIKMIITIMLSFLSLVTLAEDRFTKAMEANITALYAAGSIEELQAVANKFERIASAEKSQWLPAYYGSLAYLWMATREEDMAVRDQWLDQSQSLLDLAIGVKAEDSEIATLQGFIYMIRITVDPPSRGQSFSQRAFAEYSKAVALNDQNPRALFYKGQMEYGTAQFFKTDTAAACGTMVRSLDLFDNFTPDTSIHPNWGAGYAKKAIEVCSTNE